MTAVDAVSSWTGAIPRLRGVIDAWAATEGWTCTVMLHQLGRLAAVIPLTLGAMGMALGAGSATSAALSPHRLPLGLVLPIGFGVLSLAMASIGSVGLLHPVVHWLLAFGMICLGVRSAYAYRRTLSAKFHSFREEPISVAAALIFVSLLWIFLATLQDSGDDALIYHWAAPEQFLLQHRLVGAPWHVHWQGPLGIQILYTLALSLGGVIGIKCMSLAILVTVMVTLASFARRLGAAPWTAVVICAMAPAVAKHAWWAMSDLGVVLFWTAGLLAPLVLPVGSLPGAVVAGVLVGSLVSVKYTSVFALTGLMAWLAFHRPTARSLPAMTIAAAFTPAMWFARAWLVTGNPAFPFASSVFGGLWWGPEYERAFHHYAAQVSPAMPLRPSSILLTCRDVLASPIEFGPALASLAPIGFAAFLPHSARRACIVSLLAFLIMLNERTNRFLLPLLAVSATAAALSLSALKEKWPRPATIMWPILTTVGVLNLGFRTLNFLVPEDWCFLAGRMARHDLLALRQTTLDGLREWCSVRIPDDSRILLTGSLLRFGFRQSIVSTHVVTEPMPWRWARESRSPQELARKWKQSGVTHIADNIISSRYRQQVIFQHPEWDDRTLGIYRDFALQYLTEVYRSPHMDHVNGMFYLLRVDRNPHSRARSIPALPWTDSIFAASNELVWRGIEQERARKLVRRAAERLPEIDNVTEQVAASLRRLGDIHGSLALNRILATHGFDGESGAFDLAAQESYFGQRRAAFSALRRYAMLGPSFRTEKDTLLSVLYLNWATQEEHAGRTTAACDLLSRALLINPNNGQARAGIVRLDCGDSRNLPADRHR